MESRAAPMEEFPPDSFPLRPGERLRAFWGEPPIANYLEKGEHMPRKVRLPDTGVLGLASAAGAGFR
eukprot:11966104-Alexandrium_andersonii.AAC.1